MSKDNDPHLNTNMKGVRPAAKASNALAGLRATNVDFTVPVPIARPHTSADAPPEKSFFPREDRKPARFKR